MEKLNKVIKPVKWIKSNILQSIKLAIVMEILVLFTNNISAQSYNFETAEKAFQQKDFDKALDYFSREISDNPKGAMSYYYKAIIYNLQNKNSFALSNVNNAIKYFLSKDKILLSWSHILKGDIYLKIDNLEKTFEEYEIALKLTPDEATIYIYRAQIYFDLKEYKKAEEDYKLALVKDESLVVAWAGLGRNYLSEKKYSEAEKILNKLIKFEPKYNIGYKFRARLYYEQERYKDAIDDIFYAFSLDDTDEIMQNILIFYSKKNYPLSISKVNAQIVSQPEKDLWYIIRVQLFEDSNNFEAASKDYSKLIELSAIGLKPLLLTYRGENFLNLGWFQKAISDFTESISIDSTDAQNYGYRADAKRLLGNYTDAVKDFTEAIKIDPSEPWFYYRRGWVKDEFLKDFMGGLDDYNQAIAIDKDYTYAYLHRGRLYESQLKKPQQAKEDYLTIISIDTTASNQGNCRQYALFHLGRNAEAIEWQNKILEQYPTEGNYYDAACLYSRMHKPKEAIENLRLAFKNGNRNFVQISKDDDLDFIRNLPEFKVLVQEWKSAFDASQK
ncbi:MAG: tetratricopeptide repeat protein [Lutibacter sp.]